jgi:hypothetical protein
MIKNWNEFLLEAKLNIKELDKPIDGVKRLDVLLKKISVGDPLEVGGEKVYIKSVDNGDGEFIDYKLMDFSKIDTINYFLSGRNYKKVFITDDGKFISLNMIDKTRDFGSRGSGVTTRDLEILQSIFLDIYQNFSDDYIWTESNTLDKELIIEVYNEWLLDNDNRVFVRNIPKNLDFMDISWVKTLTLPTKKLFEVIESQNFKFSGKWNIYHTSYNGLESPYRILYNFWKKLKPIGLNSNFNKWIPADVYLADPNCLNSLKDDVDNLEKIIYDRDLSDILEKLRVILNNYFIGGYIIPISMKKILNDNFSIIINNQIGKDVPTFKIKELIIGDITGDLMGIGSRILCESLWDGERKDILITIDSSNTALLVNPDAEVEGKTSRHGKISYTRIIDIISSISGGKYSYLSGELISCNELNKLDELELKKSIIEISNSILSSKNLDVKTVKTGFKIEDNKNKLISRLQSLLVLRAITYIGNIDKSEADSVVEKILRYALSIQTDLYKTPHYLRIL